VKLSVETKDARVFSLSLSLSLSLILGGDVADLQIYREGKHICALQLDVAREKSSCRSFSWLWWWNVGFERLEDVFLFAAMFCNRWNDRFV
jgi:hypothetical protein